MKIELLIPNTVNPLIRQWKKFQVLLGNYQGSIDDYYGVNFLLAIKNYQQQKK